jgi:hypothetical protein
LLNLVVSVIKTEPDFVAVDKGGVRWLLESKGQENVDVLRRDITAVRWCETARH